MDLTGFKAFNFSEGSPYVSITKNGVTFNRGVVMKLDYPVNVLFLINDETKEILLQPCNEEIENSTAFYKDNNKSKSTFVRWNARDLLNTLEDLMNWNLKADSYRVPGVLLKEDNIMLFDFKKAEKIN